MAVCTRSPHNVARCLNDGGVVLMPTDTLPGFHARLDAAEAVARIRRIKGRDEGKPLLALAASVAAARAWTAPLSLPAEQYLERCWPGPFTLILPLGAGILQGVVGDVASLALRVPAAPTLRELLQAVTAPIVSTSVNLTGEDPAWSLSEAAERFGDAVDMIGEMPWDPGADRPRSSTLIDLTVWPPRTLREGGTPAPDHGNSR